MDKYTLIRLRRVTVEKLKRIGSKKETYDDIINRLIKIAEKEEGIVKKAPELLVEKQE
jgi:hypothetical protein